MSVYLIQAGDAGPIKIGVALNIDARLREMQTGNPEPLNVRAALSGSYALESQLHRLFGHCRYRGEWFRPESDLLAFAENSRKYGDAFCARFVEMAESILSQRREDIPAIRANCGPTISAALVAAKMASGLTWQKMGERTEIGSGALRSYVNGSAMPFTCALRLLQVFPEQFEPAWERLWGSKFVSIDPSEDARLRKRTRKLIADAQGAIG